MVGEVSPATPARPKPGNTDEDASSGEAATVAVVPSILALLREGVTSEPAAPALFDVEVLVDANTMGFGASIGVGMGLRDLIGSLPLEARSVLSWVPNIILNKVAFLFSPSPGRTSFTLYANAGIVGSPDTSAEVYLATLPVPSDPVGAPRGDTPEGAPVMTQETAFVVGVRLSSTVDLAATPLFGSMLSGITFQNLGISYASHALPADSFRLPPPARAAQPSFVKGVALRFTIAAGDSSETFELTPSTFKPPKKGAGADVIPGGRLSVLYDADAESTIQWFSVQKSFGPLTIGRIGILTEKERFGMALDASVTTTAFSLDLAGFTLAFPPDNISPSGLQVDLAGLAIAISSGSFKLSGSLIRSTRPDYVEYEGSVLIQIGRFGIVAAGAYASFEGSPSLFVFGMVKGAFGGPPAFFVTGLAAGFGYNRALKLPAPDMVSEYPLVRAARVGLPDPSVNGALGAMSAGGWVPPDVGSYWVALGIQWTTFQLLNGFVLVTVQFGNELVFALLGVGAVQLPVAGAGTSFAYAELTLSAVLRPTEGSFQMMAMLTSNSFVLARACRLTGGFAFYSWFGSHEHAGDFVVTLGGYNALFDPPDWYPRVDRLGFDWAVSDAVRVSGGTYFALTPSCVMGGGALSIKFQLGGLQAWFNAHADFIMFWRPFFFDVAIGVSIGVSYTFSIGSVQKSLSVELSAEVELWGPPLKGVAHVTWWVISFTIPINGGGKPQLPGPVVDDWTTFADSFLPVGGGDPRRTAISGTAAGPSSSPAARWSAAHTAAGAISAPPKTTDLCMPRAAAGLAGTIEIGGQEIWLVTAAFVVATESAIPSTLIVIGELDDPAATFDGPPAGVFPMGSLSMKSRQHLRIVPYIPTLHAAPAPDLRRWRWLLPPTQLPGSLWSETNPGKAELSADMVAAVVGITGVPPPPDPTGPPAANLSDLSVVELHDHDLPLPTTPSIDGSTAQPTVDSRTVIGHTIAADAVFDRRRAITEVVEQHGIGQGLAPGRMDLLAEQVLYTFPAPPMLGPVGSTGPRWPMPPRSSATKVPRRAITPVRPRRTARARAVFRRPPSRRSDIQRGLPWQAQEATRATVHHVDGGGAGDHALLGAVLPGGSTTASPMCLLPGVAVLWELPGERSHTLVGDGRFPLWVAQLDLYGELMEESHLGVGEQVAEELLTGARHVVVSCVRFADPPRAVGWQSGSSLLLLQAQALLGEDVLVRCQSGMRVARGRRSIEFGVVSGAEMIGNNWTDSDGGNRLGFVVTLLPRRMRTVVVAVAHDADDVHFAASRCCRNASRPEGGRDRSRVEVSLPPGRLRRPPPGARSRATRRAWFDHEPLLRAARGAPGWRAVEGAREVRPGFAPRRGRRAGGRPRRSIRGRPGKRHGQQPRESCSRHHDGSHHVSILGPEPMPAFAAAAGMPVADPVPPGMIRFYDAAVPVPHRQRLPDRAGAEGHPAQRVHVTRAVRQEATLQGDGTALRPRRQRRGIGLPPARRAGRLLDRPLPRRAPACDAPVGDPSRRRRWRRGRRGGGRAVDGRPPRRPGRGRLPQPR